MVFELAGAGVIRITALILSASLLASLAACQPSDAPPKLSLEAARQVTADFQKVETPPRSIADITEILRGNAGGEDRDFQALVAQAEKQAPAGLSGPALGAFLVERGNAAYTVGRLTRARDDLTQGLALEPDLDRMASTIAHTNLAMSHFQLGHFSTAVAQMEAEVQRSPNNYSRLGNMVQLTAAIGDLETARLWRGRIQSPPVRAPAEAEIFYRMALANATADIAEVQADFETAYANRTEALNLLLRVSEEARPPARVIVTMTRRAMAGLRAGKTQQAEIHARETVRSAIRMIGRNSMATTQAIRALAEVLTHTERWNDAEILLNEALQIHETLGMPSESMETASLLQGLGNTLAAQGRWSDAHARFEQARGAMIHAPDVYETRFSRSALRLLALIRTEGPATAGPQIEAAYRFSAARLGNNHRETAKLAGLQAMVLAASGREDEALSLFASSFEILTSRSRGNGSEEETGRASVLQESLFGAYVEFLATQQGRAAADTAGFDAIERAFHVAETARGGRLNAALAASSARAATSDPNLADLARREQDARQRIDALYTLYANLGSLPDGEQDRDALNRIRTEIDALRGARAALMEEIERGFPDYAELVNPKPSSLQAIRAVLKPSEAMLSYFVGPEAIFLFAIPKQGPTQLIRLALDGEDLADRIDLLRAALDPQAATLGDIPAFDLTAAYQLYTDLLGPVAAEIRRHDSLLVVPDGALGQLPLGILPTRPVTLEEGREPLFSEYRDAAWLVRDHAVTLVPSASALVTLRQLPPGPRTRQAFAGFGDPYFTAEQAVQPALAQAGSIQAGGLATRGLPLQRRSVPQGGAFASYSLRDLPRLPDTSAEVTSMALALNSDPVGSVFLGRSASEGAIKRMVLQDRRVIAFATHGLVPGELDGLTEPALALSSPALTGETEDGLLTLSEIMTLKLDADWIVLSACNTAAGDGKGAEAISGLGRAFFYAGARAVLATSWPVETTSARWLTERLFSLQAANPEMARSQSLRQAMIDAISQGTAVDSSGRAVFSYAHPIFWAPFLLIGDGG